MTKYTEPKAVFVVGFFRFLCGGFPLKKTAEQLGIAVFPMGSPQSSWATFLDVAGGHCASKPQQIPGLSVLPICNIQESTTPVPKCLFCGYLVLKLVLGVYTGKPRGKPPIWAGGCPLKAHGEIRFENEHGQPLKVRSPQPCHRIMIWVCPFFLFFFFGDPPL